MADLPSISLKDLEFALEWASERHSDCSAALRRSDGAIFYLGGDSDYSEPDAEPPPSDIGDPDKYLELPTRHDLDLGQPLVFDFVDAQAPALRDAVQDIFRRRGAYSRFKDLLEQQGLLERWHHYSDEETKAALQRWARDNGFEVST